MEIFQNGHQCLIQIIQLGRLLHSTSVLKRFGLGGKERSFPHQLSGGEMQRTSIARALAGGQPLLLCDEPSAGLDPVTSSKIFQLIEAMHRDVPGGIAGTVLRVDGGMVASDWTMQCLADILDAPVDRPQVLETTALGAASTWS